MAEGEENPVQPGGFADREEDLGNLDVGSSSLERRALLKLDLLIIPMLSLFYFLSYLDRSNLGNVRIVGLQKDLHMSDSNFSMALTATSM
ncbi:hypothetical protein MJO28_014125 [Puccinia striiformis f. sp. tritici]|uniref:Major facilitator superfamily (MFS) profile domain-containing protein n=2 Tax=Puccinia striiformis TaxID=27350 RepID=A0A2S4V5A9_9BASI|nr:hypothetical protein MJO28_014125 [Puccinia striiformis f. sp. tritici]KAI7941877.1 hypothetical protein MJO29_013951 [Puccinia striiformis f. sp. tritici]POW04729.1 hypothetical protein PSTT_10176 [Puccinia striiformis]